AYDILNLLAFSKRPLKLREVVDAIAFNAKEKCFTEDEKLQDPLDVLQICSSLITLQYDNKEYDPEVRFAHFSVQEYLVSDRTMGNLYHIVRTNADLLIAERCLIYLISNLHRSTHDC